jgi:hypothetical protein
MPSEERAESHRCPKCGGVMNPPDTCVGCKWRYKRTITKCWTCLRTIVIEKHEPGDKDNYKHECGHEEKVKP